jgi:hypothetical protein
MATFDTAGEGVQALGRWSGVRHGLTDHGEVYQASPDAAQPVQSAWDPPHATGPAGTLRTGGPPAPEHRGQAVITVQGSTQDGRHGDP